MGIKVLWFAVAILGAIAYAVLALRRHEEINSAYILIAALCSYATGFRFYSKWIAARVLVLDDHRATPCEVHDDGKDYVKTNKWIVFGHHFAAISGPGPLVGPVLAAQFGYLPLWTLLPITVLLIITQEMCSRMGAVTGKGLSDLIREEFGLRITFFIMALLLLVNLTNIMANFAGIAGALEMFHITRYISVPIGAYGPPR